jgi:hypothetical protein
VWRAYPWAHALFPIGGVPPPFTDPSYCAARSFGEASPPVPLPPVALGSLGAHAPAGFPRHRTSIRAPQRWACGAPATGFGVSPITSGGGR